MAVAASARLWSAARYCLAASLKTQECWAQVSAWKRTKRQKRKKRTKARERYALGGKEVFPLGRVGELGGRRDVSPQRLEEQLGPYPQPRALLVLPRARRIHAHHQLDQLAEHLAIDQREVRRDLSRRGEARRGRTVVPACWFGWRGRTGAWRSREGAGATLRERSRSQARPRATRSMGSTCSEWEGPGGEMLPNPDL